MTLTPYYFWKKTSPCARRRGGSRWHGSGRDDGGRGEGTVGSFGWAASPWGN
jgi:hypothetical protein